MRNRSCFFFFFSKLGHALSLHLFSKSRILQGLVQESFEDDLIDFSEYSSEVFMSTAEEAEALRMLCIFPE